MHPAAIHIFVEIFPTVSETELVYTVHRRVEADRADCISKTDCYKESNKNSASMNA